MTFSFRQAWATFFPNLISKVISFDNHIFQDEELVKAKGACKEATKALESQVEANQNMEEELARLRSEVKASVTEVEELRTKMRSESDKGGRFEALYHDTAAREFQVQGLLDQTMERVKVLEVSLVIIRG